MKKSLNEDSGDGNTSGDEESNSTCDHAHDEYNSSNETNGTEEPYIDLDYSCTAENLPSDNEASDYDD